jgi:hypothetical protein
MLSFMAALCMAAFSAARYPLLCRESNLLRDRYTEPCAPRAIPEDVAARSATMRGTSGCTISTLGHSLSDRSDRHFSTNASLQSVQ